MSKSLKGCKGNRVPAQLDHPSQRMGLWNLILSAILSKVQVTPQRMSQVTFKAMGSERLN